MQLALEIRVAAVRCGIHVVDTLPHLIEEVLAQLSAPVEQPLELKRLRILYKRRHDLKATARRAHVVVIGHISPPHFSRCRDTLAARRSLTTSGPQPEERTGHRPVWGGSLRSGERWCTRARARRLGAREAKPTSGGRAAVDQRPAKRAT
jgi:hypothetical protein